MNLEDLKAELAQQNEALATAMNELTNLGDVQIQLPAETLRGVDDACAVHVTSDLRNLNGLRA